MIVAGDCERSEGLGSASSFYWKESNRGERK
jgi:hypothetical protein